MGSKNKLKRFKDNEKFSNVIQPSREELLAGDYFLRGKWSAEIFKNELPIVLELGCGKGEYSIALAQRYPQKNFIGIDIKGARFWRGAKTALEKGYKNVAFVRAQIELLDLLFAPHEIEEIWITFPDPQIKYRRSKHRLTHPNFLAQYKTVLKPGGRVHLKTDSEFMHGYTSGILQGLGHDILYSHHDIYRNPNSPEHVTSIKTFYEKQYLEEGKPITYLKFKFN